MFPKPQREVPVVYGVEPAYQGIAGLKVVAGRFFDAEENERATSVCVLGEAARASLFAQENPLDKYVKANDQWYRVIGVVAPQVSLQTDISGVPAQDRNNLIYVPLKAAFYRMEDNRSEMRDEIDGILVQLPLPPQVDAKKVLLAVDPAKDVDGFHPMNVGYLSTQRDGLVPCTPAGVMEILKRSGIPVAGQEAVVVGRSNIVGKPVALMLLERHATVTICHSRSKDLPAICRSADVLIAAVGRAEMVKGDWIKPGAVVIDVGTNRVDDPTSEKGYRLAGDVAFNEAKEVAGWLSPYPGGVGPMTITMLMKNTVTSAKLHAGLPV